MRLLYDLILLVVAVVLLLFEARNVGYSEGYNKGFDAAKKLNEDSDKTLLTASLNPKKRRIAERLFIIRNLKFFKGDAEKAAKHTGVPKDLFLRKIVEYGIDVNDYAGNKKG